MVVVKNQLIKDIVTTAPKPNSRQFSDLHKH